MCMYSVQTALSTCPKKSPFQLVNVVLLPHKSKIKDLRNVLNFQDTLLLYIPLSPSVQKAWSSQTTELLSMLWACCWDFFVGFVWGFFVIVLFVFCLFLSKLLKKDFSLHFPASVQPTHYFSRQVSPDECLTAKSAQVTCKKCL